MIEHKNKFIRQMCKEDMFKWTVTGLIKKTENVLKQNNTMNIEEIYFEDFDEAGGTQTLEVKTLAKFKDFSGKKRPVSRISWKNCQVTGHFLKMITILYRNMHGCLHVQSCAHNPPAGNLHIT